MEVGTLKNEKRKKLEEEQIEINNFVKEILEAAEIKTFIEEVKTWDSFTKEIKITIKSILEKNNEKHLFTFLMESFNGSFYEKKIKEYIIKTIFKELKKE